ncbi:methyltransferase RsmF C-terminal domain-like protein [Sphingobacterium composti Ten et al. 2007 non Yoo et al. 2007]|uniref:methyltransferase RsmF C-terminal domain-like protein n=1 Tax=Sphingobacterium composti TaxID=363260 RepID=UPI00135C03A4|nr:RNA methyltransferase [Sphingobacterium composti Ten et al. 2007 non Yoo et al. 2007]
MSNILPNDLLSLLKGDPSFDYEAFVAVHDKEQKTTSIRINPLKDFPIENYDIERAIPWCENAYYLKMRPVFTLDPLFHSGSYYSQEASSMFLDHVIRQLNLNIHPIKALDLCAAPGGKSTLINSALHKDSLLLANEIIKSRVNILTDNLVRWGNSNTVISNNDPSAYGRLPGYFDFMVVDAPCSGSGMFHKDHSVVNEWSLANVKLCSERQQRILSQSIATLKTGGYLFYSTCSYSNEENEEIVDWLIEEFDMESVAIEVDSSWGITITESKSHQATGYRFYPHLLKGEGFFCAILRKKAYQETFSMKKIKMEKNGTSQNIAKNWIDDTGHYSFIHHNFLHIFPIQYEQDLQALQNVLYLKNAGTEIGELKGKDLIPSHDLALSNLVRIDLPFINLDLEQAQNYLRKEQLPITINTENLKGWIIVRYKGVNLGWIKAMPNRINNYYPKEIRIWNL